MSIAEVGSSDEKVAPRRNRDGDADRWLSVAEIQQACRELRARKRSGPVPAAARTPPQLAWAVGGMTADGVNTFARGGEVDAAWVIVVAADPGAGCSTVALAIADAAGATGQTVHVVETAPPERSGLVAATGAELGVDGTPGWQRGRRGEVTVYRRAAGGAPPGWPHLSSSADGLVVVDFGLPASDGLDRLAAVGGAVVVVCHSTVPGMRFAEQLLDVVAVPTVVAAVGSRRYRREVNASLGPRLGALQDNGHVVPVPTDRRLQVAGITTAPLPPCIARAGGRLLALLEEIALGTGMPTSPRREGTS